MNYAFKCIKYTFQFIKYAKVRWSVRVCEICNLESLLLDFYSYLFFDGIVFRSAVMSFLSLVSSVSVTSIRSLWIKWRQPSPDVSGYSAVCLASFSSRGHHNFLACFSPPKSTFPRYHLSQARTGGYAWESEFRVKIQFPIPQSRETVVFNRLHFVCEQNDFSPSCLSEWS